VNAGRLRLKKVTRDQRRVRKEYNIPELERIIRNVAVQLRAHREELGISQNELARRASISKTTVNDLENEVASDVQVSTLCLLAKVLKKQPIELMTESDLSIENGDRKAFIKAVEELGPIWKTLDRIYRRIR
jgi:transcriptional regulator with XRE-family HTH domain